MYLTVHNQLTLLHDFLHDQANFHTVSDEEYRQIKKLIQRMVANKEINHPLLSLLPEIYYYGIKGETAQSFTEHIYENKENISRWLRVINETKLKIS